MKKGCNSFRIGLFLVGTLSAGELFLLAVLVVSQIGVLNFALITLVSILVGGFLLENLIREVTRCAYEERNERAN